MPDIIESLKKERVLTGGLLILAGILIFGYIQLGWFNLPEYLVVVTAEEGVAIGVQDSDGCFALTLKDADNVIWFSDRPERDAGSIPINVLVDTWQEEFGSNPPNADLQLFDENGEDVNIVVVLESTPVWSAYGHTLTFGKACSLFSEATEDISGKTFGKAVLFIDDIITGGIYSLGQLIGHAVSHETKHSTTALVKAINFGNWEEHAAGYAVGVVNTSAEIGGAAGGERGGREGEIIGSRIGAELGIVVVQTTAQVALGKDVDGTPLVDPHDFYLAIKKAVEDAADNLNLAYGITDYILDAKEDEIRANFFDSLNKISAESGKDTFCGEPIINDNDLFDVFMYYLRFEIESRIYQDLQDGMSVREIMADVTLNLIDDIQYSLLRAVWELQYYCVYDEDDLYTHIFVQMYVVNYIAGLEKIDGVYQFPELGMGYGLGRGVLPQTEIGYPSMEKFIEEFNIYYTKRYGPQWKPYKPEGLTVAETYAPLLTAEAEESLASANTPLPTLNLTSLESNPVTRLRYEEFQEMFTLKPSLHDTALRDSASFGGVDSPTGQLPELKLNPYAIKSYYDATDVLDEGSTASGDWVLKPLYEDIAEEIFNYEIPTPRGGILSELPARATQILNNVKSTLSNFTHTTQSSLSLEIEAESVILTAPDFNYYSSAGANTSSETSSDTTISLTSSEAAGGGTVARFEYVDEAVVTEIIESSVETALEDAGIDVVETL